MNYRAIRIAPEYGNWPFWDDVTGFPINPVDLAISEELKDRIERWDQSFQATLNEVYPPDSSFASQEEEAAYYQKGEEILNELMQELPGIVCSLKLADKSFL